MKRLTRLLKRDWPYLTLLAGIFILSIIAGQKISDIAPNTARILEKQAMEQFVKIAKMMQGAQIPLQILIIWKNNVFASLIAIFAGVLLIPMLPLVFLIGNGLIIGLVQRLTEQQGLAATHFFLALLPHGIFEIPAFIIAVFLGARLSLIPYRLIWHYFKTRRYRPFIKIYLRDLRYYALLFVALLFVAAIIEMTISPMLVGMR